jgi:hypothetical protein
MTGSGWGISQWVLLILAAAVVAGYFGVLGPVLEALEDKIEVVEKKLEQRFDKPYAQIRSKLEKLGNQPKIQEKFVDPETAWVDAAVVLSLFVFLTPIAVTMAVVLLVFLCAGIAHSLPLPDGMPQQAVVAALLIGCAIATFVVRDYWVPYAQYYAGWVAKAYLVATSS